MEVSMPMLKQRSPRLEVTALVLALGFGSGCASDPGDASAFRPSTPYGADAEPAVEPGGNFVDGGAPMAPDAGPPKTVFYVNSDDTVYSADPDDLLAPLVPVGKIDCVGTAGGTSVMTDIAVSRQGKLYGVSAAAAWPLSIQGGVVHCDAKWPLPIDTHFNGLTFAPENTVKATEVLIAANATGALFQIDEVTGATTQVGTLGVDTTSGKPWTLSGDLVFLANNGDPIGFATVRTCNGTTSCGAIDTLVEIDVKAIHAGTQSVLKAVRGPVKRGPSCANAASPATFGSIFGIVAYKDKVYGFSRRGDFIQIDNNDGSGCLVSPYANLAFAGAGITTLAPVTPPPPK
jgi:hypothetical protein